MECKTGGVPNLESYIPMCPSLTFLGFPGFFSDKFPNLFSLWLFSFLGRTNKEIPRRVYNAIKNLVDKKKGKPTRFGKPPAMWPDFLDIGVR